MKKIILYLLLISYATVLLKPVLPLVGDALAHTFWRVEHISTVHIENGKSHVHFELLNAAQNKEEKSAGSKIDVFSTPHLVAILLLYTFLVFSTSKNAYRRLNSPLSASYLQGDFPPPKS